MTRSPRVVYPALALALTLFWADTARASIITSWDMFGVAGESVSVPPTFSAPGVAGSLIIRGSGLTPVTAANSFNSSNWTGQATDYVEFGFNVAPGYQVSLDGLKIATRSSNTGPGSLGLYTSLDNYANPVATFNQVGDATVNNSVDLSSLGLITDAFRVRIIQIGTTAANGGTTGAAGTFRIGDFFDGSAFQDIQFEGSISPIAVGPNQAVPEPSTLILLGAALTAAATLRGARRRRTR